MVVTAQNTRQKPGYKQTEVGIIPEDWEVKELSELTTLLTNGFVGKATDFYTNSDDGVIYIQGFNVEENSYNLTGIKRVTLAFHKKHSKSNLLEGDLLTIQTGEIGLTSIVPKELEGSNCHALIISRFNKKFDPKYFSYYFNSFHGRTRLRDIETGSTMKHLNVGDLHTWLVPFPPNKAEQSAIATVLRDVDALIASLDKLIAKKRDIKHATMQQLLTGKTRLPGFSGEWEVKRFEEIFQFLNTANNSRSDLSEYGEIKYIHYGDIHVKWRSFLDCESNEIPFISKEKVSNVPFLEDGDLVMADASEDYEGVGISIEVKNATGKKVVAGLHTLLLRGNKTVLADGFKGYIQYIPTVKDSLKKTATGISVYGISKNNIKNLAVCLPSITEQQAIATVLSDIDAEIVALEQRRDKTCALKQGMMQELLTGKTRLL